MGRYDYKRRPTTEVKVGGTPLGGSNPVRIQSMANTSTMDTAGSVAQTARMVAAGAEYVRFTAQGEREARNLAEIKGALLREGIDVPLVADIHFNPRAAFEAARHVEKVRINPGNFVDPARTFRKLDDSDEAFAIGLKKIEEKLVPFLELCRSHGTAIRIGVNHGSLSDRIMSRYGDTPAGMVESVMEFLRICREENFDNIVISIKASNPTVMVATVRLLCEAMEREGMRFPLHLGVTEAGDGEDGRIKSAVGIGTLMSEGIGDTIRVSLSEPPEDEIPVARKLRDYIVAREGHPHIVEPAAVAEGNARDYADIPSGWKVKYPVVGLDIKEIPAGWHVVDASDEPEVFADGEPVVISSRHINAPGEISSYIDRHVAAGGRNPFILHMAYDVKDAEDLQVRAGADLGSLLLNGYGNGLWLEAPALDSKTVEATALGILQASRLRMSKTEFISCPSCGRTLFDLQETLREVKAATSHLKGLKIGVMGCIVNGPGEMADADYGYVGAGPGRISLYKNKELVKKNLPRENAVEELIALIRENGDWRDPE